MFDIEKLSRANKTEKAVTNWLISTILFIETESATKNDIII